MAGGKSTSIGLLLIIKPGHVPSLFSKFLGLMAALCWATGTILIKRLRSTTPVDLVDAHGMANDPRRRPLGRAEPGGH